ncbi:hypothetical protein EUTSA_v10029529mg [Eutrema salsugineum]|uniref:Late embryogenesis abundant protein LEA-2 subgroup domain-containing protein n=1 Tax=Eutrema salsugineum TaxID=72664 RepID=V4MZ37_EUTSA|nr:uncharacterized protein LOC18015255 [Eutrema salsugineum]ESQ37896.1 hypothetical protein EUTSA_v10029529mg [Eutrema salsugineum]
MSSNAIATSTRILFLFLTVSFAVSDQKTTGYDAVKSYNLPAGILPKGVVDYKLNPKTGDFNVYFNGTCKFSIQSYQLKYNATISGVISTGNVKNLNGVSVKVLLFWVNKVEVSLDSGNLDFSVGVASASFPAADFVESPQCGCGFDCNGFLFSS